MDALTLVGGVAAIASTASFAPQAWKIIRTRETRGISAGTYTLACAAFALWLAYGALSAQWPLIATNGVCLLMAGFILVMKLLPRGKREEVAAALDPTGDEPSE